MNKMRVSNPEWETEYWKERKWMNKSGKIIIPDLAQNVKP